MKKLMNSCSISKAVAAGADPDALGVEKVIVHELGGTVESWISKDDTVYVTAGRTCLIVNGTPAVAVETEADIRVCCSKTESLGCASMLGSGMVVFDRKKTLLSFTDNNGSAVEKARAASVTCMKIASKLKKIKKINTKHPVLAKRERSRIESEMRSRIDDRKRGRAAAKRIADERIITAFSNAMCADTMLSGETPFNKTEYDRLTSVVENNRNMYVLLVISRMIRKITDPSVFDRRIVSYGRNVVSELKLLTSDGHYVPSGDGTDSIRMATVEGAARLAKMLNG